MRRYSMNSLVGYASDSDGEANGSQQAGPSRQAVSKRTRASPSSSDSDSGEDAPDVTDAFGLQQVGESSKGSGHEQQPGGGSGTVALRAAPEVTLEVSAQFLATDRRLIMVADPYLLAPADCDQDPMSHSALIPRSKDTEMHVNVPYSDMTKPISGPSNPFSNRRLGSQQNALNGHYEGTAVSDFDFRNQQRTFETMGYVRNPSMYTDGVSGVGGEWAGDASAAQRNGFSNAVEARASGSSSQRKAAKKMKTQRLEQNGDLSLTEGEGAYMGPWAGWKGEQVHVQGGVGPSEEEIARAEELSTTRKREKAQAEARRVQEDAAGTEKSVFHGKSMYDYQGRSYLHVPGDVDTNLHGEAGEQTCFVPKSCIHTWTGHTKGVSAVRLFPQSGHLMLSASMDTKIKVSV